MNRKIKVLVVTYHPWREDISVGNTLSNIFDGMEDKIEFANIYVRDDKPSNELVGRFFNISEKGLAKSILTRKSVGKEVKAVGETEKKEKFSSKEDERFISRNDVLLIDIRTRDYRGFVDKVVSCEKVISSSLHGIIIAESYGVPAMMHQPTVDPLLKYCDWYYSTGRMAFPTAKHLEEVLTVAAPALPDLTKLREGQKKAFPYDLWEM